MRIEHIALWTRDLETLRKFYVSCFGCECGPRYHNPTKGFSSYFLKFESGGRLELMQSEAVQAARPEGTIGLAHFALSVGTEAAVRAMTDILRARGVPVLSDPRWTGDGYYESVVSDPDGNAIEITA